MRNEQTKYRPTKIRTVIGFLLIVLVSFPLHANNLQATQKAANDGEALAQYDLAMLYLKGDGVEKDSASAIKWLKHAAEQDFSSAQYKLGIIYREGRSVATDMDLAIEYLTLAADQGNASAQYALGDIYRQGDGIPKDLDEAQEWLELAAGHGMLKAQTALKELDKTDLDVASANQAPAIENSVATNQDTQETAQSAHEQGMKYLRGDGVSKDFKTAAKWFTQAAEQGYADAQYQLGELFKKGRGVKRNKKQANKWYRAAADQGHIKAGNRLGGCGFC